MDKNIRVLLVEDSEDDAALLLQRLRQAGYQPAHARVETADAMRDALNGPSWDLVLSDHRMPHFSSLEALALLREINPDLPFILVSGSIGEDAAVEVMKAGANDYIAKEHLPRLIPAVERELREAEIRRQRRAAELALIASEERFKTFMNNGPFQAFIKDETGRYVFVNPAMDKFLKRRSGSCRGMTDEQIWPPAMAQKIAVYAQQVRSVGKAIEFRESFTEATGKERHMLIMLFPINDPSGRALLGGVVVDNTGLFNLAQQLHQEQTVLNAINRVFHEALTCKNDQQVARQCLTVAEELTDSKFGMIGELNVRGRFDTIAISDPGWSACNIPETDALAMVRDMPIRGLWSTPLTTGKSQIINDPKIHPDRVGTPEGHPPIECFLGVPLVRGGKSIGAIALANKPGGYTPEDRQAVEALSVSFVEALMGKRAEMNLKIYTVQLEQRNRKLKDYAAVIAAKTHSLREHAAALEKALRAKDDFLASMSHELRTPLNAIIGFSEGLLERADRHPLNEHQKDRIAKINKSGEHLLALINQILNTAGIEAGNIQVNPVSFDLATLADEIGGMAEELLKNIPQVRFEKDVQKDLPPLLTDPNQLQQILINLIGNAAKFIKRGAVKLWARRDGSNLLLSVEDTGIGIPDEHLDRLFEKFYQVPEAATGSLKGTGLGLSICKTFSQLLGGKLTVRSIEGEGSAFTLCIPMNLDPRKRQDQERRIEEVRLLCLATPPDPTQPKALSIESEPTNVALLHDLLLQAGYQLLPAFDGEEGLFLATSMRPDVVILNILLSGLEGWETLRRIKANPATSHIPVIVAGASEENDSFLFLGASEFLVKPIDKNRLADALSEIAAFSETEERCVAVVADDPRVPKTIGEALEEKKWRMRAFDSGKAFLDGLRERRPDGVILDFTAAEPDAFQVLDALQDHPDWASIPVIALIAKVLAAEELLRLNQRFCAMIRKRGVDFKEASRLLLTKLEYANQRELAYASGEIDS